MTSEPIARVELPEPPGKKEPQEKPEAATEPKVLKDASSVSTQASPAPSRRKRAVISLLIVAFLLTAWWVSGYFFAYTDDAYLTSDVVNITPEVSGPVEAVHVADNQWVKQGTPLFTIDPLPFKLELDQARAREAQAGAQLPIDQAEVDNLQALKRSADAAAELAISEFNRVSPVAQSGYLSAEALDRSRAARDEGIARQHAAGAALESAEGTLHF
ncbi:MAG: HlyD family secretion protein, partial [Hyphomicrobiales bacterium]|nr:HlyD family secretion protein [Hyphomicrobiales bacterium]